MNILNCLISIAASFWARYRRLPPAIQLTGGLVAVVGLAKVFWPAAFVLIIVGTVILLLEAPERN